MAIARALVRLRTAAWLGWQVESNWADPVLFTIYVVARPLAVALILVAMYRAVRGGGAPVAAFVGFYLANAFHSYANKVVVGMGWAVFEEREEYETLKYVYASPVGMFTYLLGRSGVKFALATISTLLTLGLGWWGLGVRWEWAAVRWLPLAAAFALSLVAAVALAFLLAGWMLVLARAAFTALDGVMLALYLLCGVIFPVDLLPPPLRALSLVLPFTWWYEALRRFVLGRGTGGVLGSLGDAQVLGALALTTLAFAFAAQLGYGAFERRARRLGRLDQTTLF